MLIGQIEVTMLDVPNTPPIRHVCCRRTWRLLNLNHHLFRHQPFPLAKLANLTQPCEELYLGKARAGGMLQPLPLLLLSGNAC